LIGIKLTLIIQPLAFEVCRASKIFRVEANSPPVFGQEKKKIDALNQGTNKSKTASNRLKGVTAGKKETTSTDVSLQSHLPFETNAPFTPTPQSAPETQKAPRVWSSFLDGLKFSRVIRKTLKVFPIETESLAGHGGAL